MDNGLNSSYGFVSKELGYSLQGGLDAGFWGLSKKSSIFWTDFDNTRYRDAKGLDDAVIDILEIKDSELRIAFLLVYGTQAGVELTLYWKAAILDLVIRTDHCRVPLLQ